MNTAQRRVWTLWTVFLACAAALGSGCIGSCASMVLWGKNRGGAGPAGLVIGAILGAAISVGAMTWIRQAIEVKQRQE